MQSRGKVINVALDTSDRIPTRELFFDKEVFGLLEQREIAGKEEWLYKAVTKSIRGHFYSFPLYINRVTYIADNTSDNYGCYIVWCIDTNAHVTPIVIDLANTSEKGVVTDVRIKDPVVNDVSFYNEKLNPLSNSNFSVIRLGNSENLAKTKLAQREKFRNGTVTLNAPLPKQPTPSSKIYNTTEYTLDDAIELFPEELSQVKESLSTARQVRDALDKFNQQVDSKLKEGKCDAREADEIKKRFFGTTPNVVAVKLVKIEDELGIVSEEPAAFNPEQANLIDRIERDTKLVCTEYKNIQQKLSNLKDALAYAIYKAVHEYYIQEVQIATEGNPKERKKKIKEFNKHFVMLGCLQIGEDGTLSDISLVYQTMEKMSLKQIQEFVTKLLRNGESGNADEGCDTTIFFNSKKLKRMVASLNQTALEISATLRNDFATQISRTQEPLFKAEGKTYALNWKLTAPAKFEWHPDVLKLEQLAESQVTNVKKYMSEGTELQDTNQKFKESGKRKNDYTDLRKTGSRQSPLAESATVVRSLVLGDEDGLVTRYHAFSSYMSDLTPAKEKAALAKELLESLDINQIEFDLAFIDLKEKIKTITDFNSKGGDPNVMKDVSSYERKVLHEEEKYLQLAQAIKLSYDTIMTTIKKLDNESRERKKQLLSIDAQLKSMRDNLAKLNSIAADSLRQTIQSIDNTLAHEVQTIDLVDIRKKNPKLYIQKRIESTIKLLAEHVPGDVSLFKNKNILSLLEQYESELAKVTELDKKYKKESTGIDEVETDLKTLDDTYNKVIELVQQINYAVKRQKAITAIIHKTTLFNPNADKSKNEDYHQHNLELVKAIHTLLLESNTMTEEQKRKLSDHISSFEESGTWLGEQYKKAIKFDDTMSLEDINTMLYECTTRHQTNQKALTAIKHFPALVKFQKSLAEINRLIEETVNRSGSWKEKSEKIKNDKVLTQLIDEFNVHRAKITTLQKQYGECDVPMLQELDISVKELDQKLIQAFESAYACEQAILHRISLHDELKSLNQFVIEKIDPSLIESDGLVSDLSPGNDDLDSLIVQYQSTKNQLLRYVKPYRKPETVQEDELPTIQKTRTTAEVLFQNVGEVYSRIERRLAFIAMNEGQFLEKIVGTDPYETEATSPGVATSFVISQHALLTDSIASLEFKAKEFAKQYSDIQLEDWPLEAKLVLDFSYRMRKLRHELELSFGNTKLSELRAAIAVSTDKIDKLRASISSKATPKNQVKQDKITLNLELKNLKGIQKSYSEELKSFRTKLSKEQKKVSVSFYKRQVSSMIDVMTSFNTQMSSAHTFQGKALLDIREWMASITTGFTSRLNRLINPFAQPIEPQKDKGEVGPKLVLMEREISEQEVENKVQPARIPVQKMEDEGAPQSPVMKRLRSFRMSKCDTASQAFDDIIEIDIDEAAKNDQENKEIVVANAVPVPEESPVPKIFLEIDAIMLADPDYSGYLLGAERQGNIEYDEFITRLKKQMLFNDDRAGINAQLFRAYFSENISLITLIRLHRMINPPTNNKTITLADLDKAILAYDKPEQKGFLKKIFGDEKQGFFRKIFGETKTVRDLKLLRDQVEADAISLLKRKPGQTWKQMIAENQDVIKQAEIPVQDFELIFALRDARSSITRKGVYQHESLTLFRQGTKPDKKNTEMSQTEVLINQLRTQIRGI